MDLAAILAKLTPEESNRVAALQAQLREVWMPRAENAPQQLAYVSDADVIGYGGAAGGGKTDLAIGMALTRHKVVQFFRREGTELGPIIDRCAAIVGHREGLSGRPAVWRNPTKTCDLIEFCSVPHAGDETAYQGRAKDLLVLDEASNFLESQVRFLMGWVRSVDQSQRCQTLLTFNPPTTVEGRWVISFFAPWIDKKHPRPAKSGELRWFAMVDDHEIEVPGPDPVTGRDGRSVRPMSRTFVAARVKDNPDLATSRQYLAQLDSMPEPMRSLFRDGDFAAATEDDPFQVIPTEWVEAAMARWKRPDKLAPMESVGIDIAKGGKDNTILARRHVGMWFDVPLVYPGTQTPDGPTTSALCIAAARDKAVMHLDVFGAGSECYGFLMRARQRVLAMNVGDKAPEMSTDAGGKLGFFNLRSMLWWRMREALNPTANTGICLPPDRQLLADLCAATWEPQGNKIKVHSTQEIKDKIGRSPDWGTAYVLALIDTPALREFDEHSMRRERAKSEDVFACIRRDRRSDDREMENPLSRSGW